MSVNERLVMRFTVASPLHIGTQQGELRGLEFVGVGNQLYVVDELKWAHFLAQNNLVDHFVKYVRENHPPELKGFLKLKGINSVQVVKEICSLRVECSNAAKVRTFRPMIRDGLGRVYIPGSSIKGAMRTAILSEILENSQDKKGKYENMFLRQVLKLEKKKLNKKKYKFSSSMQKELLCDFELPGTESKNTQNRDLLRCLKVSDAYPDKNVKTRVIRVKCLSKSSSNNFYWSKIKKNGAFKPDLEFWIEAVTEGVFEAELAWDKKLYEIFSKNSPRSAIEVKSLCEVLQKTVNNSFRVVKNEIMHYQEHDLNAAALKNWYCLQCKKQLLRLGFGGGMLATTVNINWSQKLFDQVRNTFYMWRGGHAPKSRRVRVEGDQAADPLGWVVCEFHEQEFSQVLQKTDLGKSGKNIKGCSPPQKTLTETGKRPSKRITESKPEEWPNAWIRWIPGEKILQAELEGKKARAKGDDLVPESVYKKVVVKKKAQKISKALVEPLGNGWKLVAIKV